MTSKKTEAELIGRAVVDSSFRQQLLADPERTIAAEGYEVGSETLQRIRDASTSTPEAVDAAIAAAAREGGVGM
ncbi:Franean1_4349 family RiPP [Sorangium sp. So ce1335]|uniref:Franean1_4349 family RiPP n=1 Tax=Sorangium sp. So ce1335 TaxID=3133335 RepID=UPI003F5E3BD6